MFNRDLFVKIAKINIILLFSVFLFGCGPKKSDTYVSKGKINLDADKIIAEIQRQIKLPVTSEASPHVEKGAEMMYNAYKISDLSVFSDYCALLPLDASRTEISVFIYDTGAGKKAAEEAVENRIRLLESICEKHDAKRLGLINDRRILRYDNALIFIITENDNNNIEKIVDNLAENVI